MQGGGVNPDVGYGLVTSATTDGGQRSAPDRTPLDSSGDISDLSHLDSFFATTGWTREDVLVVAAVVQLGMWLALLYLEVNE